MPEWGCQIMYRYYDAVTVGELYAYQDHRCKLLDKGIGMDGIAWAQIGTGRCFDTVHLLRGDRQNRKRIYDLGLEWEEHKKERINRKSRNLQARCIEQTVRDNIARHRHTYTRVKYVGFGDQGELVIRGGLEQLAQIAERLAPESASATSALESMFGAKR